LRAASTKPSVGSPSSACRCARRSSPAVSSTQHSQQRKRATWGFRFLIVLESFPSSSVFLAISIQNGSGVLCEQQLCCGGRAGFFAMNLPCTSTGADCHIDVREIMSHPANTTGLRKPRNLPRQSSANTSTSNGASSLPESINRFLRPATSALSFVSKDARNVTDHVTSPPSHVR
jgi:hypothetical protein